MESGKASKMLAHQYALTDPLHQIFDAIDAISVQGYDENRRVIYWNKGSELRYDKNGHDVNVYSNHVLLTNQYNKKQMYCIVLMLI